MKKQLENQKAVFSFESQPLLASLTSCLGLQSEMGTQAKDRLSLPLNIHLEDDQDNPWQSEIITLNNKIGLRLWIEGIREFYPDHPDFSQILHPLSLDQEGRLSQIIIFPEDVYHNYKRRQLELVIVRDWALSAFLQGNSHDSVNYFFSNEWEVKNNTAKIQTQLMKNRQLAFSGTHDLTDHLLGGQGAAWNSFMPLYQKAHSIYEHVFSEEKTPNQQELFLSYTIGVLLDDLAQPRWYQHQPHANAIELLLIFLKKAASFGPEMLFSFDSFVEKVRSGKMIPGETICGPYQKIDILSS
ncbi:MAG: hypothetical protein AAF203_04475 [Pseudomonadota bacterium]